MKTSDYINLTLKWKGEPCDFSHLEYKLNQINESSSDLESFYEDISNPAFTYFSPECSRLTLGNDLVSLETHLFELNIKCNKVISLCNHCVIALYGYFHPEEDLKLKFCNKGFDEVRNPLTQSRGAYSLVYVSLHKGYVFVSKDEFGFKSLLVSFDNGFSVSNKATNTLSKWYELPPFVFLVLGDSPSLFKRSGCLLHQLTHSQNADYNLLDYGLVSSTIDRVTNSLVKSVLDSLQLLTNKEFVTILFSGGLDSTLLSLIVLQNFQNSVIELFNIAFDSKSAPDRITCLLTYEELCGLFPDFDLRLILMDVSDEDYSRDEPDIFSLCYPNHTHMDLNISSSLYYVGRLKGYLFSREFFKTDSWLNFKNNQSVQKSINFKVTVSKDRRPRPVDLEDELSDQSIPSLEMDKYLLREYVSQNEHVLMGTGADELFGGYGRHLSAKIFDEGCFNNEINKDIMRLWKRNLGRDDRVLNFRNLTAIYPFLSNTVINCLKELPFNPAVAFDLLNPPNWFRQLGFQKQIDINLLLNSEFLSNPGSRTVSVYVNKWMLREICFRLGLRNSCNFKKRAIQFGTRSAKVFNRMHNLSNRQASNKGSATFTPP